MILSKSLQSGIPLHCAIFSSEKYTFKNKHHYSPSSCLSVSSCGLSVDLWRKGSSLIFSYHLNLNPPPVNPCGISLKSWRKNKLLAICVRNGQREAHKLRNSVCMSERNREIIKKGGGGYLRMYNLQSRPESPFQLSTESIVSLQIHTSITWVFIDHFNFHNHCCHTKEWRQRKWIWIHFIWAFIHVVHILS